MHCSLVISNAIGQVSKEHVINNRAYTDIELAGIIYTHEHVTQLIPLIAILMADKL